MKDTLSIWTIYDHPTDYPEHFVARRFELDKPTNDISLSDNIEDLRTRMLERGLTCLTRSPGDDPKIMETWL